MAGALSSGITRGVHRRRWTVLIVAGLLAAWEGYARFLNPRGPVYFPGAVFSARQSWANREMIWDGIVVTLSEAVSAFLLAMALGIVLGILIAELAVFRQMSMPFVVFAYSFPHAILAPLFVIWFGRGLFGVALFGAWVAFFPVFINTLTGMSQTRQEFRYLGRTIGATPWQMLRYIEIWEALPHIASSARIAVQLSIVGVVIAEFIATGTGLGYLVVWAVQRSQIGLAFGAIVAIMIVAVTFYKMVSLVLRWITPAYQASE